MEALCSRGELLRRGAGATALLGAPAVLLAARADRAGAATPDSDLAYVRLLVGVELLKLDFARRALAAGKVDAASRVVLGRVRASDGTHYRGLAAVLRAAGEQPASAGDIDFSYPRGTFASRAGIGRRASTLARLALGAYLGAIENVETAALRLPLGQIAANEAQQVAALATLVGRPAVGGAFAPALTIAAASAALDEYES